MWKPVIDTPLSVIETVLSSKYNQKAIGQNRNNVQELVELYTRMYRDFSEEKEPPTALVVRDFEELAIKIQRALGTEMDNLLYDILDKLETYYPNEVWQIKQYLVLLHCDVKSNILLKGAVQSGKTTMIILFTLAYTLTNTDVVILLRNKNDDKRQFERRMDGIMRKLTHISSNATYYPIINHKRNIHSLMDKLKARNRPYALIVDEADMRENNPKDEGFWLLFSRAQQTIFVSATVQDICIENFNIPRTNIIQFQTPEGYRGIDSLQFYTYPTIRPISLICTILEDEEYKQFRLDHPRIILVTKEFQNKDIKDLVAQISCIPVEKLWTLQYIGEKDGIILSNSLLNAGYLPRAVLKQGRLCEDKFIFKNGMSISQVLLLLAKHGGAWLFKTIVIVAGRMADRGINFASYDALNPQYCWHLTHQILDKSPNACCANVTQSLRILGVHKDKIPLKVYTTPLIVQKICTGNKVTDSVLKAITVLSHPHYISNGTMIHEVYTKVPIDKTSIPPKYLSRNPNHAMKLVKQGGINVVKPPPNAPDADLPIQPMTYKIPDNLRNERQRIYNLVVQHIPETGKWFERARIIEKFASPDESAPIRGTMYFMAMENGIPANEGNKGLLFKKFGDRWYVRLN